MSIFKNHPPPALDVLEYQTQKGTSGNKGKLHGEFLAKKEN
jgi:hypothetical protein